MRPEPTLPERHGASGPGGFGRLVTERLIRSGWHCRWCPSVLVQDGAAVICPTCDKPAMVTGQEGDGQ